METNEDLFQTDFAELFNTLPALLKFGDFEIKDMGHFFNEIPSYESIWEDYKDSVFNFLNDNMTEDHCLYSKDQIFTILQEEYADEEEIYLDEDELLLEYLHKVNSMLREMERRLEKLWSIRNDYYEDGYENKSMFITALHSEYFVDIEGITFLKNIVSKNISKCISADDKLKQAEQIAKSAHLGQKYGDHKGKFDYYTFHLDSVRNEAIKIGKQSGIHQYKIEIVALLHDLLEDTHFPEDELKNLFGERILNSIRLLTYRHGQDEKEYYRLISEDRIAAIVKAADRIVNISQLKEVSNIGRREELFIKYFKLYPLFDEFDIYPTEIANAFFLLV
ncbi:MAG: hypothetical protein WCA84_16330 [Ignavibacteriaceae bacterium]